MSLGQNDKADFFISYTSVDSEIAEWIAWQLEEVGYRVVLQKWDFIPGSSFVREMRGALEYAHKMVAVISNAYFKSKFAMSEWDAAFAKDPSGMERNLIPVRVEKFDVSGLAKPRVYIDIIGCDEDMARQKLLAGVQGKRLKPSSPPKYPLSEQLPDEQQAARHISTKPRPALFSKETESDDDVYIPPVRKKWTDNDKDDFLNDAFDRIHRDFEAGIQLLRQRYPLSYVTLEQITKNKFVCRFDTQTRKNSCKIWISEGFGRAQILFSEGFAAESENDNVYNEIFSVNESDDELFLCASMFNYYDATEKKLDKERLTPDQAFVYLWRRFVAILR